MITAEIVRDLLEYNPITGIFTWRPRQNKSWNAQFAGKKAGSIKPHGYVTISIYDKPYYAQRLAWLYVTGEWPIDEMDHRDGNPSNNSFGNLRPATRQENQRNRACHKSNSSGFKGVYKNGIGKTWAAQVYLDGRKIHVGNFPTAEEAHAAYCIAARQHYGDFARTT